MIFSIPQLQTLEYPISTNVTRQKYLVLSLRAHTLNVCLHVSLGIFTKFLERLIVSVLLYVPNSPDRKLILLSLLYYDIILNEI